MSKMKESYADVDFYLMKISRMEADMSDLQEELMTVRLRLRTAEDFQIKYQLLLKQSQQQNNRLRMYEEQLEEKIHEALSQKLAQKQSQWKQQAQKRQSQLCESYQKQISQLQSIIYDYEKRSLKDKKKQQQFELLQFTNKKLKRQNQIIEQQISSMKSRYEVSKQQQIMTIKQEIQKKNHQKMETQRKSYLETIQSLEGQLQKLRDKNTEQIMKPRHHTEQNIQDFSNKFTKQLNQHTELISSLQQQIDKKNNQIDKLIDERIIIERTHSDDKDSLKQYIKGLQDKLYSLQASHADQLFNIKQRMQKIRQEECQVLRKQIFKINSDYDNQRDLWDNLINQRQKQQKRLKQIYEDQKKVLKGDNKRLGLKIQELKARLKQLGDVRETGQTQQMIKSMKQLESKESEIGNYENGVTFLERKLNKCIAKIQTKNIEISNLRKQLNDVRVSSQKLIDDAYEKAKIDKKNLRQKIEKLQDEINQLHQKLRKKELQHKKKEKANELQIQKLKATVKSANQSLAEAHRDYSRVTQNKKDIQNNIRLERQKGQASRNDISSAKKQKWVELQKQKSDLQVCYKQKQDQLKKNYEIQSQKIRHERDKLLAENQSQRNIIQNLKGQTNQSDKQNRRKLYEDYQKKVATLNLQIAFTENMYKSLKKAKSQIARQQSDDEDLPRGNFGSADKIQIIENSMSDQLSMSFNPKSQ